MTPEPKLSEIARGAAGAIDLGAITGKPGNAAQEQITLTNVEEFLNWGKENSLWYLLFATACCGIELMQTGGPRYDTPGVMALPHASVS